MKYSPSIIEIRLIDIIFPDIFLKSVGNLLWDEYVFPFFSAFGISYHQFPVLYIEIDQNKWWKNRGKFASYVRKGMGVPSRSLQSPRRDSCPKPKYRGRRYVNRTSSKIQSFSSSLPY